MGLNHLQTIFNHAHSSLQKGLTQIILNSSLIFTHHVLLLVLDQPFCHFSHYQISTFVL